MRVASISVPLEAVPVDFFADPDGPWDYDQLARELDVDPTLGQLSIGALTETFLGFPEGAAVVLIATPGANGMALVEFTADAGCIAA